MKSFYKILHTTCHTGWGGLEKRIFNESVWMKKNGHTVILAAPPETPLFLKAKAQGFKVYPVDFKFFSIRRDYRRIKRILYNEAPWIINTHGNQDSKIALLAAKRSGTPLRILSRHISAHVNNSFYNRIIYKKLCHYIFTTADYTTRHLQDIFNLNEMKVFSMPSGISIPETLPERETARQGLAEELELDPNTRFVGFVGRVSADKGVGSLIEAFAKLRNSLPGYHVAIVGSGIEKYINSLRQIAKKLDITSLIHFTGFKEDVWPYYRALDCSVLPSKNIRGIPFEGVPQALLEAMFCETPVIGSKSGGITDIIKDGQTGLLFDPDNTADLAEKLQMAIKGNLAAQKRAKQACEMVKKHHTLDAMGRNIIRIYRLHQVKLDRENPASYHYSEMD